MAEGLSSGEANQRLLKYGRNEIRRTEKKGTLKLFLMQFTSPLILVLIGTAFVSWAIGFLPGEESSNVDAILIAVIVVMSSFLGFFQEYKAEQTIEVLRKMAAPKTKVIRDGAEMDIPSNMVVPGDIVVLDEGDVVPADAQIVELNSLQVNEAPLTGESVPVTKKDDDEVFMHTYVVSGNAKAKVASTGMNTKVGQIAGKLQKMEEEKTSFEKSIAKLSKVIMLFIGVLIAIIGGVGFFKYDFYTSILTAISLAVAAIPEGLPAVVSLTLAVGAKSMSGKNALIRKLSVTESVGVVNIIATDKTGTLTRNEMTVDKVYVKNMEKDADNLLNVSKSKSFEKLFLCGILCNKSHTVVKDGKEIDVGDPTETALRKLPEKYGYRVSELKKRYKQLQEIPFSSDRKMMSVVFDNTRGRIMFTKGAPEILIEKCDKIMDSQGNVLRMTDRDRKQMLKKNEEFASEGLRILGFAYKEFNGKIEESNLVWIGLQALMDPPRKEVKQSLVECGTAGIRIIMLTGDNPLTAKAIAAEIGLKSKGVITGKEMEAMSDDELKEKLDSGVNIFARVSPNDKLKVLEVLNEYNEVAMTGDGVNDALALKKAGVGISMGIRGTEVAKQASDIILLDDNFSTIVSAVKEGRRIFDNIKKFLNYLFASNLAEVAVIFIATMFLTLEDPILLPIQILWINLLTDGLPALALGLDPAKVDIMNRPPRKKDSPLIDKPLGISIVVTGLILTVLLLAVFFIVLPTGVTEARTALFTGFVLYEFLRIATIRKQEKLSWWSNKWLLSSIVVSLLLQLVLIYTFFGDYFLIAPLTLFSWGVLIGGGLIGYVAILLSTKFIVARFPDKNN